MTTLNFNSLGNYALVILGLSAGYLTTLNLLKEAAFVGFIALVIKGLLSEAQNQKTNTTSTTVTTVAEAPKAITPTAYVKIRSYFTRAFYLY